MKTHAATDCGVESTSLIPVPAVHVFRCTEVAPRAAAVAATRRVLVGRLEDMSGLVREHAGASVGLIGEGIQREPPKVFDSLGLPGEHRAFVDRIEMFVDRIETFVDQIDPFVDRIETFINRIETFVNRIETFVDRIETFVDRIETFVDRIETFVDRIDMFVDQIDLFVDRIFWSLDGHSGSTRGSRILEPQNAAVQPAI